MPSTPLKRSFGGVKFYPLKHARSVKNPADSISDAFSYSSFKNQSTNTRTTETNTHYKDYKNLMGKLLDTTQLSFMFFSQSPYSAYRAPSSAHLSNLSIILLHQHFGNRHLVFPHPVDKRFNVSPFHNQGNRI